MKISDGSIVSIEYTLTFGSPEVIDSNVGKEPLEYKQGEQQNITGLEKQLEGMAVGESKQIVLAPEEAYGPSIPEAVIQVALSKLPDEVQQEGAMVEGKGADGETMAGQVKKISKDEATIDFNHPMAGKTLHFEVKILSVK